MICPRCGTEFVYGSYGRMFETSTTAAVQDEHTTDRCADVLAARCKALEAERDAQPRKRIDGCQHTRRRMNEWIDESACPICLTATLGVRNNKADAFTRRVAELEEELDKWERWEDVADEYEAAIREAFPTRSDSHEEYAIAMRMVGNRHMKLELVALVNWLLVSRNALTRRVAELEKALKRIAVEHCNYKDNADDYDTGVTDGHRCAAQIARDVLALTALAASQAPRKDGET